MLFNSYEFIFAFLPLVVLVFFAVGRQSRVWALRWVIAASLFFYGWWRPLNLLIITPSILVNFILAHLIERSRKREQGRAAKAILLAGIAFNVAFLGYFKYSNFIVASINDVFGTQLFFSHVILPLGISFITFQKIAFLIDVDAGRIESFSLQDYCLFVLFFPQLIAGPIVHFREMMPQFRRLSCRFDGTNVAVGITLFAFGLFEKVYFADHLARYVTPLYEQAAAGASIALSPAWVAAIGFTFQIYFDFSGYTNMALGIARLFGLKLPPNFNSPLRATSIIEFWLRWHMTLTRFLTAYIYNPLALWLTRRRAARGAQVFAGPPKTAAAFVELLAFPTLLTMLLSGIWHGAGYTFIVWGVLHGFYLTINHGWRVIALKWWPDRKRYERLANPAGFVLTFACVAVSMILFRSPDLKTAYHLLQGMLGLHGLSWSSDVVAKKVVLWIAAAAFIALACPNALQILAKYEPAFGWKPNAARANDRARFSWEPSLAWAIALSVVVILAFVNLGGNSEFLYWQF